MTKAKFITITTAQLGDLLAGTDIVAKLDKLYAEQQVDQDIAKQQGFDGPLPPQDTQDTATDIGVPVDCNCVECENIAMRTKLVSLEARNTALTNRHERHIAQLKKLTTERDAARGELRKAHAEVERLFEQAKAVAKDSNTAEQASAWFAVFEALSQVLPGWNLGAGTGKEKAVATIHQLAAGRTSALDIAGELAKKVQSLTRLNSNQSDTIKSYREDLSKILGERDRARNLLADIHGMTGLPVPQAQAA